MYYSTGVENTQVSKFNKRFELVKNPRLNFKFLTGDYNWEVYGGKFVTRELSNGEFSYYIVMEVINWHDATGEENLPTYYVGLSVVAPTEVPEKEIESAKDSFGLMEEPDWDKHPLLLVECLSDYGISAHVGGFRGNNLRDTMRLARMEAFKIWSMFGYYMDALQNRIGSTGWDLLKGDILAGLQLDREETDE